MMESLRMIPLIALIICVAGIVLGASAITLAKFKETTTDTTATNAINNASAAVGDIGENLGTVAVIGIMVIVISLLAGLFVYFTRF